MSYRSFLPLIFLALSCGQPPQFLHHVVPVDYKVYSKKHKVKDLEIGTADIIWVIDNSGSMADYQKKVIENMDLFINAFIKSSSKADWQMALMGTEGPTVERPVLGFESHELLNHKTPDAVDVFSRGVRKLGSSGRGDAEQAFVPIMHWLNAYPKFIRKNALLFVIIISDEKEHSPDLRGQTQEKQLFPVSDFVDYLKNLKGSLSNVATYTVTSVKEANPTCKIDEYKGSRYEEYVLATAGKHYSICDDKFGLNIGAIGEDIVAKLHKPRINLESRPVPGTLKVFYEGRELTGGVSDGGGVWSYDIELNAVVFDSLEFAEGDIESVELTYEEYEVRPE